jgi:molybdenum cofactor synthesis domain-containing protein
VLACIDRIFTGQIATRTIGPGQCTEISTGAPMPPGADAVVMVERTSRDGDRISVRDAVRVGQNVGRRGGDIAAGQLVVRAGDVISPARAGALTAVGHTSVDVFDRPRVAILSTGSEVTPPGVSLPPGHVYDVNGVTLAAIVNQHGGEPFVLDCVEDSVDGLAQALEHASTHDLIVTSGGSSVGSPDLLLDALDRCGRIDFHGIAVKPGKPTLFGRVGPTPLFGMPGNPTSCLSNAYILLVPFLRKFARLPPWQPVRRQLPLARAIAAIADRHQFYTVRIVDDVVQPAFKSSGDITSMAAADGYIEVPAGSKGFEAGETVTVTLL